MFRVLYNSTVIPCYAPGAIRDYSKMLLWLVCSGVAEESLDVRYILFWNSTKNQRTWGSSFAMINIKLENKKAS